MFRILTYHEDREEPWSAAYTRNEQTGEMDSFGYGCRQKDKSIYITGVVVASPLGLCKLIATFSKVYPRATVLNFKRRGVTRVYPLNILIRLYGRSKNTFRK